MSNVGDCENIISHPSGMVVQCLAMLLTAPEPRFNSEHWGYHLFGFASSPYFCVDFLQVLRFFALRFFGLRITGSTATTTRIKLTEDDWMCRYMESMCIYLCVWVLPLITVGELHVHAVSAEEGLAVKWCVNVGGVRDRFTEHDHTGQWWLFISTWSACRTAVVHFKMTCAV